MVVMVWCDKRVGSRSGRRGRGRGRVDVARPGRVAPGGKVQSLLISKL